VSAESRAGWTQRQVPSMFAPMHGPARTSRFLPRTRDGWIAAASFVVLLLLAMPPVTHALLDRTEPWILGIPFFFAALFLIYSALIGVLVWAYRRGL
jgi:hypothetical protein